MKKFVALLLAVVALFAAGAASYAAEDVVGYVDDMQVLQQYSKFEQARKQLNDLGNKKSNAAKAAFDKETDEKKKERNSAEPSARNARGRGEDNDADPQGSQRDDSEGSEEKGRHDRSQQGARLLRRHGPHAGRHQRAEDEVVLILQRIKRAKRPRPLRRGRFFVPAHSLCARVFLLWRRLKNINHDYEEYNFISNNFTKNIRLILDIVRIE